MTDSMMKISVCSVVLWITLVLAILPIYPCNFTGRTMIGIGPGKYSNSNETHMLIEVMVNGFDWTQRDIKDFEHFEKWQHNSNPLYSVFYIGILIISVILLRRSSRKTSDGNCIFCGKNKANTLFKILGIVFIIVAIYFSVVQLLFFFAFPTMYLSMNAGPLFVYVIIIAPIYYIIGYNLLLKWKTPRVGKNGREGFCQRRTSNDTLLRTSAIKKSKTAEGGGGTATLAHLPMFLKPLSR